MSIEILRGQQNVGAARSMVSMTLSTSTTAQTIDWTHDVINLGMGTEAATGFQNAYVLATATGDQLQGKHITVQATATGRANLTTGGGTSTGAWVISSATEVMMFQYHNLGWLLVANDGATVATTT